MVMVIGVMITLLCSYIFSVIFNPYLFIGKYVKCYINISFSEFIFNWWCTQSERMNYQLRDLKETV